MNDWEATEVVNWITRANMVEIKQRQLIKKWKESLQQSIYSRKPLLPQYPPHELKVGELTWELNEDRENVLQRLTLRTNNG